MVDKKTQDLTIEEKNLLSVTFKNMINPERKAIKMVADITTFEKFARYEPNLNQYRKKIE